MGSLEVGNALAGSTADLWSCKSAEEKTPNCQTWDFQPALLIDDRLVFSLGTVRSSMICGCAIPPAGFNKPKEGFGADGAVVASRSRLGGFHIWRPQNVLTPSPLVTVTNQQIVFLLSAFWGPPPPTHCGRHKWKPPRARREWRHWREGGRKTPTGFLTKDC